MKDCISWSGPLTSGEELIRAIKLRTGKENFIVKTEMAYFAHTYCSDKLQRPDLYKLNRISFEEKLETLLVLSPGDSEQSTANIANLPNNQDVMKFISNFLAPQKTNRTGNITVNQLCVTVWLNEEDNYGWYIGYVKEI